MSVAELKEQVEDFIEHESVDMNAAIDLLHADPEVHRRHDVAVAPPHRESNRRPHHAVADGDAEGARPGTAVLHVPRPSAVLDQCAAREGRQRKLCEIRSM